MNCHLKFRIIPPETAYSDPLAVSHKPQVLKLVWDEQGRGECCNGFNIIPKVIWWDFHTMVPSARRRAAVLIPIAHSHCSVQAASAPWASAAAELTFKWLRPWAWLAKTFSGSFHSFSGRLYVLGKDLFPLLVQTISALMLARCHCFKGFFLMFIFKLYCLFYTLRGLFFLFSSSGLGSHFLMQQRLWWKNHFHGSNS